MQRIETRWSVGRFRRWLIGEGRRPDVIAQGLRRRIGPGLAGGGWKGLCGNGVGWGGRGCTAGAGRVTAGALGASRGARRT